MGGIGQMLMSYAKLLHFTNKVPYKVSGWVIDNAYISKWFEKLKICSKTFSQKLMGFHKPIKPKLTEPMIIVIDLYLSNVEFFDIKEKKFARGGWISKKLTWFIGLVSKNLMFAYKVGGWVKKRPKTCLRNIWMVPKFGHN